MRLIAWPNAHVIEAESLAHSERRYILGMRVDATSYSNAVRLIMSWAKQGSSRYVCEAPVSMVMEAHDSPAYRECINESDLVTPGGMPIVWLMRATGLSAQPRVYGPDLMLHVCAAAARYRVPVGFLGATDEVVRDLAACLQRRYPGLPVVFQHAPPYREFTSTEDREITDRIADSGCRILFVGLGCPKQERWMAAHRGRINAVMLGVGAGFDFLSGHKPQAPPWVRERGGEWLFRLLTEPRRLWPRYAHQNPRFVMLILRQLLLRRRGPSRAPALDTNGDAN